MWGKAGGWVQEEYFLNEEAGACLQEEVKNAVGIHRLTITGEKLVLKEPEP